jgi:CheY-like chemotaxis protein
VKHNSLISNNVNINSKVPRYKSALLIDDDEIDNYITQRVLKSTYFVESIVVKSNGLEALDYLKSLIVGVNKLPDIIFLDIAMPEMDGFKFLEELKKLSKGIEIDSKVVILTNAAFGNTLGIKFKLNNPMIKNVLFKPISVDALQNISV